MDEFRGIRVVTTGTKYQTEQGFTAIKNGVKARDDRRATPSEPKPPWLKARIPSGERFEKLRDTVRAHRLATVCEESICPNIGECWNNGTATLMLMGAVCTRACQFCAVDTGNPRGWLDADEIENSARTVGLMNLKYVVLTSVDRDDLPDGGAAHFAAVLAAIRARTPGCAVEVLTPDFKKKPGALDVVLDARPVVFAHNVETVPRLYKTVRPGSTYEGSVGLLREAALRRDRDGVAMRVKSSIIVGLGETDDEALDVMRDLKGAGVDVVTLGQYLQPTPKHLPVARWVHPDTFAMFRREGMAMGLLHVEAGPLVRSSYHAERHRPDAVAS